MVRKEGTRSDANTKILNELAAKYPRFPSELGAVIRFALLGLQPNEEIVGPTEVFQAKVEIASRVVLTDEYRSAYFFDNAQKGARFNDLDWEVVIKSGERNVRRVPGSFYAVLSLETITDLDESNVLSFAADERAVRSMLSILQDVIKAMDAARAQSDLLRKSSETRRVEPDAKD